mmetsp:Transcript_58732/g.128713  ORF Transcript_58732/g.128713 Transcript_58732/m.128713 type:complete len:211 (-) Transcript_58732:1095-1727(-)
MAKPPANTPYEKGGNEDAQAGRCGAPRRVGLPATRSSQAGATTAPLQVCCLCFSCSACRVWAVSLKHLYAQFLAARVSRSWIRNCTRLGRVSESSSNSCMYLRRIALPTADDSIVYPTAFSSSKLHSTPSVVGFSSRRPQAWCSMRCTPTTPRTKRAPKNLKYPTVRDLLSDASSDCTSTTTLVRSSTASSKERRVLGGMHRRERTTSSA